MKFLTPGGRHIDAECIEPNFPVENNVSVPLLGYSGVKVLAEYIRERIDARFDCFILVTGDRGAGKSTLILETSLELNQKLSVDKIAFRAEEFAEIFKTNKPGKVKRYSQVIMDEAGHTCHAQDWMKRVQRTITKHMIVSRIKRQVVWMAVPKRSQLNNQLRDMPYIWVHVSEPREFIQGYAQVLTAPGPVQSMWHSERYWLHQFCFIFPELTGPLWEEYEERKKAFVDEVTEDLAAGRGGALSESFDAALSYLHTTDKLSFRQIEKIQGMKMTNQALGKRYSKVPH